VVKKVVKPAQVGASVQDEAVPKKRKLSAGDKPAKKTAKASPSSTAAVAASAAAPAAAPAAAASAVASPAKAGSSQSTRLDRDQVRKAVVALCTHLERQRAAGGSGKNLLDEEDDGIYVVLATKQMPPAVGKAKADKPIPLDLPHPVAKLDDVELCLITKDPQREFKDKLAAQSVRAKVIGISKLKNKYVPFEAKRQLCAAFDVFVADSRVLPMLPPLLGKTFFKKRKQPVSINLKKKDLRAELEKVCGGSLYRHSAGTSNSFKVGKTSQGANELVDNVVAAVEQAVALTPKKWSNVQALHLRSTNSVALPFYNSLPHAQ